MNSSYCNVTFNWVPDEKDNVTRYSFVDVEASDFENVSFDERLDCNDRPCVTLVNKDKEENLVASIVCLKPEHSQISGISIDSESRTLEISNNLEGYIKTVRGKRLPSNSATDLSTNGLQTKFFVCSSSFEKPYASISIKFLSLGQKDHVQVRSLKINLQQHDLDTKGTNLKDTFNVAKLRKEVEGMGDGVSEKALDFLKTMEIFEQNKAKSLSSLTRLDSHESPNTFPSGLLSGMQNGASAGLPLIMRSVLGENTMKNLLQDVSQSQGDPTADGEDRSLYSMLQAVCGSVAKTRQSAQHNKLQQQPAEGNTLEKQSAESENPENGKSKVGDLLAEVFRQHLAEAKQEMRSEVHAVKEELMTKMDVIQKELSDKLDRIADLLQKVLESNSGV